MAFEVSCRVWVIGLPLHFHGFTPFFGSSVLLLNKEDSAFMVKWYKHVNMLVPFYHLNYNISILFVQFPNNLDNSLNPFYKGCSAVKLA